MKNGFWVVLVALLGLTGCSAAELKQLDEYEKGEYTVGKDIPSGEYQIVTNEDSENSSYTLYPDEKKDKETIIDKGSFEKNGYLFLKEDTYLDIDDGCLIPLKKAKIETLSDFDILQSGCTYEVGTQISEGYYKVTSNGGMTMYTVYDSMAGSETSNKHGHGLTDSEIITLKKGQFLSLGENTAVLLDEKESKIYDKISKISENPIIKSRFVTEVDPDKKYVAVTLDDISIDNLDEYKLLPSRHQTRYVYGYLLTKLKVIFENDEQVARFMRVNYIAENGDVHYPLGDYANAIINANAEKDLIQIMEELSVNIMIGLPESFIKYGFQEPKDNFLNN